MPETGGNVSDSSTPDATSNTPRPAMGTPLEPGETPEDSTESISPESFRRIQTEAKNNRLKLREAEAKLAAREAQDLTEVQKVELQRRQVEAKEAEIARRERHAEVKEAAIAAGGHKLDAIVRLVDDDEDIGRAISRLKREIPELFFNRGTAGSANGGLHGVAAKASPDEFMDTWVRDRVRRS